MKALCVTQHVTDPKDIQIDLVERPIPRISKNECLIKINASGINPSDALAVMGYFSHAVLPRIPGRDFSGVVVEGPSHLLGKQIWGTGGAAGISSDGTQAEFIKLSISDISVSPNTLEPVISGAQPLPYVTAYYSLVTRANIRENETVLVVGALGQVGSAAMSICHWKKCKAIALVRGNEAVKKASGRGWKTINSEDSDLAEKILAANDGHKVQVVLNSVGNIYWNEFMKILAEYGRIVTIGAREKVREVTIDLFELYRANQEIIGINSVSLGFHENAKLLDEIKVGFEENKLLPLAVDPSMIYTPEQASLAYRQVMQGSEGKRVVIKFS